MSTFTQPITVKARAYRKRKAKWYTPFLPPSAHPHRWELVQPITYLVGSEEAPTETITVPAGYIFNGHSVPILATVIFPRAQPIYLAAAALHDWLYETPDWPGTRARADAIYYEALRVLGIPKFYAAAMWAAVRIGGWRQFTPKEKGQADLKIP